MKRVLRLSINGIFIYFLVTLSSFWWAIKVLDTTAAPFESKAAALRLWLKKQTTSWLNESPPGWVSDLFLGETLVVNPVLGFFHLDDILTDLRAPRFLGVSRPMSLASTNDRSFHCL